MPQTRVYTQPNTIFLSKRLRSQAATGFLGIFRRTHPQVTNRVGCRCYKVYATTEKMSNFFQRPLTAGSLQVGVHTALQGCRLARSRFPKVETLQGCRLARLQRKCQRLFRPHISKVQTRFAAQKRRVRTFRRLLPVRLYYSTLLVYGVAQKIVGST